MPVEAYAFALYSHNSIFFVTLLVMLKILKASAGSGKTYQLAKEYIRLLVKEPVPDAYRHVLAVTFTNKATDEMKSRILKELYKLSKTPEKSPYTNGSFRYS